MSWLSNHLFGISKTKESTEGMASPTTNISTSFTPDEIQNETITTSNNVVAGDESDAQSTYENREIAAAWQVPVRGKLHRIEFEHGTKNQVFLF